ncbi:MAG: sugar-transfer associated ATP-grasp domain-containing protein [Lachnospiraceae bacterium]
MVRFIKKCLRKCKLVLLYIKRILLAPNHFKCSLFKKLKANLGGGYLADQAVLYDFDHNDKHEYLSEFDWYRSRYINEPFNFLMNNKIASTEILRPYVKVPEIFAIKTHDNISSYDGRVKQITDLYPLLETENSLFVKPISAGKGKGVHIFRLEEGSIFMDTQKVSKEEFFEYFKKNRDWFVTETIHQHRYADQLFDQATNTIRLITMKDIETNEFKIFFAVQRIGTAKTVPIDNGSVGGLVSKIDLETGELSEARSLQSLEVHEMHPNSGNPIKGAKIPNWNAIKEEILALANHFPYMQFIAWDILLTEEGICIIEANTSSGVNIIQLWGGQRQGELGKFYKYHKVIKR